MKSSLLPFKRLALGFALMSGALATAMAGPAVVRGDFDNDGTDDVFVYGRGQFAIRLDAAQAGTPAGSVTFIVDPLPLTPDTVKAADIDQDGFDDVLLASRSANRLLVIYGQANVNDPFRTDEFSVAGGPAGADAAQFIGGGGLEILAVLNAQSRPRVTMLNSAGSSNASYALPPDAGNWTSLDVKSAKSSSTNPLPQFAWLSRATNGIEQLWWADFAAASPDTPPVISASHFKSVGGLSSETEVVESSTSQLGHGRLLVGTEGGIWVVFPHKTNVLAIIPSDVPPQGNPISYRESLGFIASGGDIIPDAGGDLIVVVAADGTFARLFRWQGPGNLEIVETIPAPVGYLLSEALPLSDGSMVMAVRGVGDPLGSLTALAHYDRAGNTYTGLTQINQGVLSHSQTANVMVFDRDPFGGDALEWESFALSGWASSAKIENGEVKVEYQPDPGLPGGLGEAMMTSLVPHRTLPLPAVALANQWEPDSSIFFAVPPAAPGGAGISPEPPPGSYSGPINLSFAAAMDVEVRFRLGNGAWQSGRGPVAVSQTTTVEYYGVAADGYAGPISTVRYAIGEAGSQLPGDLKQDSDKNGMDDAWERRFFGGIGVDPNGDLDNDHFTNQEEYESGTNPGNSLSVPPGAPGDNRRIVATIDPYRNFNFRVVLDTGRDVVPEHSADMTNWFPFTNAPVTLPDGSRMWTDSAQHSGVRFFRLSFSPQ